MIKRERERERRSRRDSNLFWRVENLRTCHFAAKNLNFPREIFSRILPRFEREVCAIVVKRGGEGGVGDREIEKVTKALESVGVGRRRPSSSVIYVRKTCPPRPAPRRYLSKRSTVHPAVNLFSFKRSREKIAILPPYISKRAFSSQRIKLI